MKLKKMIAAIMTMSLAAAAMPATVFADSGNAAKIGETEYATLAAAVADAQDGAIIELLASVSGAGIVIDKDITIDFCGNTYDIAGPAVGSAGTTTLGFQILQGNNVVLKNGTLTESAPAENGTDETDRAVKMLINNYSNLTVENMKLDGSDLGSTGRYVLSNNCGTIAIKNTEIIAPANGIAFDVCKYASYSVPTVTVDAACSIDGKIEVSPEATLVINGGAFTDLANAVKYAVPDATVTLLKNAEGAGIVINKNITIDFGGNTYDIVGPAVGSAGTTTLGFQILQGNNVVLKNGTLTESAPAENGTDETDKAVKMLINNYSNLTAEDMILDGSKLGGTGRYVLSNNSGNITITGATEIIAPAENGIAFDVCKYASYEAPVVTFDADFTGGAKGAFEVSAGLENNLVIYAGHFTQDPAAYVAEDKVVTESDKSGYEFMVGDPVPEPEPTPEPEPEPTPEPEPAPSKNNSSKPKYTASVGKNDVENGNVKLSRTKVKAGSKVTVTVTPDEGYKLDNLVILDKNGNKVEAEDNGDGTFTFKMPKGGVEVVPAFAEETSAGKEETTLVLTIGQNIYQMDGNYAANDVAPVIEGGRTCLPVRLIAETLGATVGWNELDQAVTIVKGDDTIVLYIGQAFALVNGEPVQLDTKAFISNERTYLPVRFISENLGAAVTWDDTAKTVTIVG